jgi:predicted metal-dependent phosphoesterase TrpH
LLIDLHCHTKVYSACSALTPDALARVARTRGLDGVALTEHDALWPPGELARAAEEAAILLFRGIEVTTEVGHVLVFGAREFRPEMATLERLREIVTADSGLMFLAHPSRRYGALLPADLAAYFDSVEALNGTEGMLENDHAGRLASRLALPGIGGSDAHSVREVAICATEFSAEVRDETALLSALRSGKYTARRV